jgi:hypothetical protein
MVLVPFPQRKFFFSPRIIIQVLRFCTRARRGYENTPLQLPDGICNAYDIIILYSERQAKKTEGGRYGDIFD